MARSRKRREPGEKKRRPVKVCLMKEGSGPYDAMNMIRSDHHPHLSDATIVLAWRDGVKADADGTEPFGRVIRGDDLGREMHGADFALEINRELYTRLKPEQQVALIDHLLCRCDVVRDQDGDYKLDDKGRRCYRTRKPTIQEFPEVVERHGLYTHLLVMFAKRARDSEALPLFKDDPRGAEQPAVAGSIGKATA